LSELLKKGNFELCTTEIFGAFQVVVEYADNELDSVLECLERMSAHLTAAVVSNDVLFQQKVLAHSVNGTTYCGIRGKTLFLAYSYSTWLINCHIIARTTGAPQNHWFGPAGDPRGAGIGTPEAIKLVWSCHREVIMDQGPVKAAWTIPDAA
jgi:1-pyrroline-5-carboxylate dehydrogenase